MQFVYGCAVSLDGFITDATGGIDWLTGYGEGEGYDADYLTDTDTIVMGRDTYEHGLTLGFRGDKRPITVLSTTRSEGPHVTEFWNRPLTELATALAERGSKNIWVMGGGITASAFLEARILTRVHLTIIPVVLGGGIKLFGPLSRPAKLTLKEQRRFKDGVVTLDYLVSYGNGSAEYSSR